MMKCKEVIQRDNQFKTKNVIGNFDNFNKDQRRVRCLTELPSRYTVAAYQSDTPAPC